MILGSGKIIYSRDFVENPINIILLFFYNMYALHYTYCLSSPKHMTEREKKMKRGFVQATWPCSHSLKHTSVVSLTESFPHYTFLLNQDFLSIAFLLEI